MGSLRVPGNFLEIFSGLGDSMEVGTQKIVALVIVLAVVGIFLGAIAGFSIPDFVKNLPSYTFPDEDKEIDFDSLSEDEKALLGCSEKIAVIGSEDVARFWKDTRALYVYEEGKRVETGLRVYYDEDKMIYVIETNKRRQVGEVDLSTNKLSFTDLNEAKKFISDSDISKLLGAHLLTATLMCKTLDERKNFECNIDSIDVSDLELLTGSDSSIQRFTFRLNVNSGCDPTNTFVEVFGLGYGTLKDRTKEKFFDRIFVSDTGVWTSSENVFSNFNEVTFVKPIYASYLYTDVEFKFKVRVFSKNEVITLSEKTTNEFNLWTEKPISKLCVERLFISSEKNPITQLDYGSKFKDKTLFIGMYLGDLELCEEYSLDILDDDTFKIKIPIGMNPSENWEKIDDVYYRKIDFNRPFFFVRERVYSFIVKDSFDSQKTQFQLKSSNVIK